MVCCIGTSCRIVTLPAGPAAAADFVGTLYHQVSVMPGLNGAKCPG